MNVFDYFFEDSKNLEKDFVLGNKETISFKNLYDDSLKIANYLQDKIGVNKNILIVNNNSVYFITVYLGIIKSGNICVPIDFSINQENMDHILETTESTMIFCNKKVKSILDLKKFNIVFDEEDFDHLVKNQIAQSFDSPYDSQQLAEIIFTSGSTGKPKGVMITHQNIISNTDSIIEYLGLTSKDIVLGVLPFYYSYGLSLLHTHLKVGGQIVLNNSFMFLGTVIRDLKAYKCTGFAGVPSHYQMLLKISKSFKKTTFPSLRYVTQAGGRLHNVFIEEFVKSFPGIKFFVMYGQTEATARLSFLSPDMVLSKLGSIGKGIPDVILKILNKNDEEVPVGEVGEIVAKGKNIMVGYFKDRKGTDETLKNGWLYTGDLGKKDKDDFIYITERQKKIIKVKGRSISPKEIEEVILSVPGILDCSIQAVDDDLLGEAIKADIVLASEVKHDKIKKDILIQCHGKLAKYKIPQHFEFKNWLKLKPTGKKA